jgi:multicomponent Na+:H+ antiporter subunit B
VSRRGRGLLFLPIGGLALAGLIAACTGLPDAGWGASAYGRFVADQMVDRRGTTDVVSAVTFDLRAFDTLGEEFILFAAAAACALILRVQAGADPDTRRERHAPAIAFAGMHALAAWLVAPTVVLAAYIISHGHITPGGGFQGGVIAASASLLVFAAGRGAITRSVPALEVTEALGAGAFALLGVGGLVFATAAFANFLGPGTPGDLLSGGTIPLANIAVGIEVAAAFTLIFVELFEQALVRDAR